MTEEKRTIVFWIMEFGTKNFTLFEECAKRLETRYEFVHAASTPNPRAFQADIIENIARADYVIADVSDQNLNVALELGIAETFNKKTIMIAKEIKLPSDIMQYRTIKYSTEFNGVDKLCAEIDEIISRDLLGEIKFGNLVKDHMPKGFVKIISEAVQFYCQNGDIENFYRRFIETEAVKLKVIPQFHSPASNVEVDPLGDQNDGIAQEAKKVVLRAYRFGTGFTVVNISFINKAFYLAGKEQKSFFECDIDESTEILMRLKEEELIQDLTYIEPEDGYELILHNLGLSGLKEYCYREYGKPVRIGSSAHRVTKIGRLYCQQFGNANDSK